ncbi:MAG: hypothetical protein WEE89_16265 [Gemmatimonadota bacterium]
MTNRLLLLSCMALMVSACSGNAPPSSRPVLDPGMEVWFGDTLLAPLLTAPVIGRIPLARADSFAARIPDFDERLSVVVADTMAPAMVRINALLLLSDRRWEEPYVYTDALSTNDERVRAAAIVALKPFQVKWKHVPVLIKDALKDPSTLVQVKALEALNESYVNDLRIYAWQARDPALKEIAESLIKTAEERGAPVPAGDAAGALTRVTATGHRINFRPTTRWQNWDAAVGELWFAAPGKPLQRISGVVETVANVIPAFVSAEGTYLVYEADREIHVRDLKTNVDRLVGPGLAPRLVPLSETFVYLREQSVLSNPRNSSIKYEVVHEPLAGGKSNVLGSTSAQVKQSVHGNYSPVRWMRVREIDGVFVLASDGMEQFTLPDPFSAR